jgi:CheY-like chemotaxis protein
MSKTLLLADDSVTIQKVVGLSFANEDVTIISVDNGDDAITRTREERPDVVLADVVMPGKNGYEVCEAIKADPALAHIPVLLLTGTFEAFDEARAESVGAAGHISKPFQSQALVDEVRRLFEATPPPTQLSSTTEPVKGEESVAMDDDAFDFFDDEPNTAATDSMNIDEGSEVDRQLPEDDSLFEFGSDSVSSIDQPASTPSPAAPVQQASEPVTAASEDMPSFDDVVVTAADIEIEQASLTSAEALLNAEPSPDDSLAPNANTGPEEPFDFSFEPSESSSDTDPLEGIDPLDSIDVEDLAQATVLDPQGASGYDVSSSDLGSAPILGATPEPTPSTGQPFEASVEPDATLLAPEFQTNDPADATVLAPEFQPDDASDADLLEAELIGIDSIDPDPEPSTAAISESPEPVLTGTPLAEPEPAEQPRALPPEAAAQAESVLQNIEPQLRAQLHDTLEKIAWESFGNITEQIIQQTVEKVEAIAWEVIPKLAETLIQEEIRRMKGTPPNDD